MKNRNKHSLFLRSVPKKVGINGISLNFNRKTTGFGRYTFSLLEEFQNYNEIKFYVFVDRLFKYNELKKCGLQKNIVPILIAIPTFHRFLRNLWTKYLLSIMAKFLKIDVFFAPDGILPLFGFKKSVATIHDLSFLLFPETLKKGAYTFFKKNFLVTVKKADVIVTGSQHSKNDIIKFYNLPEEKIQVIYHGVRKYFFNDLESDEELNIKKKFSLRDPFIFYLGTIEPRKNLVSVIKAFNSISNKFTNLLLVIGGLRGWLTEEIENEVNVTNSKKNKIILTGKLTDSEYRYLLKKTEVFLYVPLYEGFGLPVLEAMASGCRVITSNTSSLPEIVGDSCIQVTPSDIDSIAQNLEFLLDQEKSINKKAIQRAESFSWSKSAEKHVQIIKDLIDRGIH